MLTVIVILYMLGAFVANSMVRLEPGGLIKNWQLVGITIFWPLVAVVGVIITVVEWADDYC